MKTDLDNLDVSADAEKGATLEIRHPVTDEVLRDDAGNPLTITLMGADSRTFKRAVNDIQMASSARKKVSAAEVERNTVDALARATVGWSDNWTWGGKPFAFSAENCRKLYAERTWVRSQVDEFVADRSQFFTKA